MTDLNTSNRVFLTGVTGLVGSSVVVALVKAPERYDFVCLVRSSGGRTAQERAEAALRDECAFEGCPECADEVMSRVSVIDGDVATMDPQALAEHPLLKGVDRIFHCAADVNLGKDPTGRVFRINYDGTAHMVELAQLLQVKEFHYVSTAYVAGKLVGTAYERAPDIANGFNNPYEESKGKAELLVRAAGIPFTVYRPGIIIGRCTDGRIRKPLAFYRILEFMQKMKSHSAVQSGQDPSDWIDLNLNCATKTSEHIYFVPIDYVQAAIATLFQRPAVGETYHVTGAYPVTTAQILEATCSVFRIDGMTIGLKRTCETPEERLFSKFIGDLFPYFASDITFDQTNIRRDWPESAQWAYGASNLRTMVKSYLADEFPNVEWVRKLIATDPDRAPRTV